MCKGSVIERQSAAAHGAYLWFHCLFCNHWWKFRLDDPDEIPNVELTGQVVLTARNGTKHKLGSIAVSVIPEEAFRKHLQSKTRYAELEGPKLQRSIDRLAAKLRLTRVDEDRLWKILQRDEHNPRKADAWSVAYRKTKNLAEDIEELQAQQRQLKSGEYFFEGLPAGIAAAPDANGKFTLEIPRAGRYGVAARACRELLKDTETHFWFVWVRFDRERSKRLMLTNENVLGGQSPACALVAVDDQTAGSAYVLSGST